MIDLQTVICDKKKVSKRRCPISEKILEGESDSSVFRWNLFVVFDDYQDNIMNHNFVGQTIHFMFIGKISFSAFIFHLCCTCT